MQDFVKVATTDDLPPGKMKLVEVGGQPILLVNYEGNIYAWTEECSHSGGSLSEGKLQEDQVECPLHGARFNITTGEVITPPADESLVGYAVRVESSDIYVSLA